MIESFVAMTLATVLCWAITPFIRQLAIRWSLVDRPDGHRKLHGRVTPLGGGLAILITLGAMVAFASPLLPPSALRGEGKFLVHFLWLLLAGLVIVVVGLVDDRFKLRARHKLIGQLAAIGILLASGLVVRELVIFHYLVELGLLSVPFTIFWFLGAMNSLNLIDGADGLASSVGIILAIALGVMALLMGQVGNAAAAFALAGALLGFLYYNFPPAKMFLGDSGSMLIGLFLGTLAIHTSLKGPMTVALAAPLAVWAIPILDSLAAIARRKFTGRSLVAVDRAHLHHCMLHRVGNHKLMLTCIALCCSVTCGGALLSVWLKQDIFAFISVLAVLGVLIVSGAFGHAEMQLVTNRIREFGLSLLTRARHQRPQSYQSSVRLQGSKEWELLWATLVEYTDKLALHKLRLDVNLPLLQEGYHASWRSKGPIEPGESWNAELPIRFGDQTVGRLSIEGRLQGGSTCEPIEKLLLLMEPFESKFSELARAETRVVSAVPTSLRTAPSRRKDAVFSGHR